LVRAQGVGSSGDIKGTVTDSNGAVVANATVSATDAEKGTKRTTTTDAQGNFRISGLQPAAYDISVEGTGFQSSIMKGVVVHIGETLVSDFRLNVSRVNEKIEVTAESPVIETERGGQSNAISQQYIDNLPISRRDYLTFSLLLPGVSDSTHIADNSDFRVKQTPQSGLSIYGSNGRGNSVTVDGGEANDDAGGVRITLSQDAVQEFQVNRSNYSAELGSASGASINIVSRSGSNLLHGSAYGFARNDALDARNVLAFDSALAPGQTFNPAVAPGAVKPVKQQLTRGQFGGTIGFPIKTDKTFVFISYEGLRRQATNSVPILETTAEFFPSAAQNTIFSQLSNLGAAPVPCLTGQAALPAATCAGILRNVLTLNPATSPRSAYITGQFRDQGGMKPFTSKLNLFSFRIDHNFNEKNQVYLRYSFGHDKEADPDVNAFNSFSRGSNFDSLDHTAQTAWYHQFSATTQNEFRGQWSFSKTNVTPNDPGGVGLDINGFAAFGRDIFLPSFNTMHRGEIADNFSLIHGQHSLKFGGGVLLRGNNAESHTFFGGRFSFGELPGGVISPCLQVPAACGLTASAVTVNALQAFSLGLPQFYQQGFGNPTVASTNPFYTAYVQDNYTIRPNLTLNLGVRYEADRRNPPLTTDKNNIAPRVSFAWDPFGDHKTVVRGGYGIFYAPINYQIDYVVKALGVINGFRQIAQVFVPLTGAPGNPALTSAAIFQTLFAQGKIQCTVATPPNDSCIGAGDLTQFGINATPGGGPIPPLSVIFGAAPDYRNPYNQQAEFAIEREVAPGLTISGSYIYSHTLRIGRARDINLLPTAPFTTVNGVSIQNWGAPQCTATPTLCFANPLILQNNQYESTANAVYNGGIFEMRKRFSSHYSMFMNYTYSKAMDDATDFNSDYEGNNQVNLGAEKALSAFDQRHKLTIAGVFDSPWTHPLLRGFTFSPIFRANSTRPFNLLVGSDINGDHHPTTDRPAGAGRNTGIGPNYWTFDARLAREFGVGEKVKLNLTMEGFNLFNRTNFGRINNVVGNITGPFNLEGKSQLFPFTPLGFTSAFPGREFQMGARLVF
jgi:hypothetical protein